jgi:hypothetical protein
MRRSTRRVSALLTAAALCLTLLLAGGVAWVGQPDGSSPVAAAEVSVADPVQITASGVEDDDVVTRRDGVAYLWADSSVRVQVQLSTAAGSGEGHYDVCVRSAATGTNDSGPALDCRSVVLSADSTASYTFSFDEWPAQTGRQTLSVVVTADTLRSEVEARATHEIRVLDRAGDPDGDGLDNERELDVGTDIDDSDTDGDGLADGLELDTYETDPLVTDTDGDGLTDGSEVYIHRTDPTTADTDDDGLDDAAEIEEYGTNPTVADTDGDGLSDSAEVDQYGTDPTVADTDGDGLDDASEVRTYGTAPNETDTDGDGLNDALEVNTYDTDPTLADTDGDGLSDGTEVKTTRTNPTVADTDGDGLDDGTEIEETGTDPLVADTDGDGLSDGREVNAYETDPLDPDSDGDGVSDAAEVDRTPLPISSLALAGLLIFGLLGSVLWITRERWLEELPGDFSDRTEESDPLAWVEEAESAAADRARDSALVTRLAESAAADRVRAAGQELDRLASEAETRLDAALAALAGETADRRADGGATAEREQTDEQAQDAPTGPPAGPEPQATESPEIDPETMTNEQLVEALLEANGGRMRQSALVDETGWSKATVSRVLTRMDRADDVTKIDVGRGNVVALPGEEPSGAASPFDDDETN